MRGQNFLNFGPFQFDPRNEQLRCGEETVRLTNKALAVLSYLVEHSGQLVTKDDLFSAVWPDVVVSDAALVVCIRELRQALRDERRTPRFIETVHGRGYRFLLPVTTQPVPSAEFQVPSSESRSQNPEVGSEDKENQKAEDENGLVSSVQGLESKGQGLVSGAQSQELQSLSTPTVDVQTRDDSAPSRSWLSKGLGLTAVVVVVGTVLVVQYLSRPLLSPQSSVLSTDAVPAALPLPDKPSIIILPFVNLSGDPEQEYFSDGVTDALTAALSRISKLFVIARTSAFTYKGKAAMVQDISREMGVRYVVEGSVIKTDGQVRINVQLIDAVTGYHLWSERFDRSFTDIFALQDEIVQKIVTTLELQLTLEEQGFLVRKHTGNVDAYDVFLRGVGYFYRGTKEANDRARQLFEQAVALDPQYAEAHAWLGWTYYSEWSAQWNTSPQTLEQAGELAQKAIALDDSLPKAHAVLGIVYARKGQYDQALIESQRTVALDPNNADSYMNQANVLNFSGRPEEALRAAKEAIRLNPSAPPFYLFQLGWASCLTGRYAEAIAALKRVLVRNPNSSFAYGPLIGSYLSRWVSQLSPDSQDLERALAAAQQAVATNNAYFWDIHLNLGYVYLNRKQYEQALVQMERALTLAPHEAYAYAGLAAVLPYMGRVEEAEKAAEQALRLRSSGPTDQYLLPVAITYLSVGKPQKAEPLLRQFLDRYPNNLPAHLALAAAYIRLGREAEAHGEVADVLRINPRFSLEVHRERAPIKDPAILEKHIAILRKAGLK